MTALDALHLFALVGIPVGMLAGLCLGLPANRQDGLGGYGDIRRRAARLGHVAAIMLPLIGGFYALSFHVLQPGVGAPAFATQLWMGGATLLVLTLFAAAWRPRLRYFLPVPATAVLVAAALFAYALGGQP